MSKRPEQIDALIIFAGLIWTIVSGLLLALFPMYQLLDRSVVRRPIWNPPQITVRPANQGLSPQDIARLEQDPQQRVYLESLKNPFVFTPKPSWLGYRQPQPDRLPAGKQLPSNALLYLFAFSLAGYLYVLKHRGVI